MGRRFTVSAVTFAVAVTTYLIIGNLFVSATSGGDPYSVPPVNDTNPAADVVETTLTAEEATVDIGNGIQARAQTYNGQVPGPTFELDVGDTAIIHLRNHLKHATGIHWHGIELANGVDGTPFTQDMVRPGDSFVYKFTALRPGIYWYHPHHHSSTNQVFKGLYGMIVVKDPNEAQLQAHGILPSPTQTRQVVLSDMTVCQGPGSNPGVTVGQPHAYDDNADDTPAITAPWSGSAVANSLPAQPPPSPQNLCEGPGVISGSVEHPYPVDEDGDPRGPFAAADIPNVQPKVHANRTNEGTIVLTNGKNVGSRAGGPKNQGYVPGALATGASLLDVQPGQGLRLQIVNSATTRYMRLQLTEPDGDLVPLYRVGGEGGLLNHAILEGGTQGGLETGYALGEILLPPASRADVVAAIPPAPTAGVLTLWTGDFERTGGGYVNIPTVPVMHLNLAGPAVSPPYEIESGAELRAATEDTIPLLGAPTSTLLDPAGFAPPKKGRGAQDIRLTVNSTTELGIDETFGTHDVAGSYADAPHLDSTRYAKEGDILELSVENATGGAHHPFHLHGFSFQPIKLDGPGGNDFTWHYPEFRDNVDVPPGYRLVFRVKLDPRPLADSVTPGGALGRWLFHCHIFFHSTNGMLSEVVITDPSGNERPNVNVDNAELSLDAGETATVTGTYKDPDGDPVSLSASVGSVVDNGGGSYTWTYPTSLIDASRLAYITATDSHGLKGQIPFHLEVGPTTPNQQVPNNQAPVLKKLEVTPKVFAAARATTKRKRASTSKKRRRRGTKVRFNLSEPATVQFGIKRVRPGERKLTTFSFSRQVSQAGNAAIGFTGRARKKALPPGRYRLTAQAIDGGGLKSSQLAKTFRIVR